VSKYSKSKLLFSPVVVSLLITLFALAPTFVTVAQTQKPLLGTQVTNVTATTNITQNATLQVVSMLSGRVMGSSPVPIFSGTVIAQSGNQTFTGPITFSSTYQVALPNGTYKLTVQIFDLNLGGVLIAFELPGTVTVTGNRTFDITVPASPMAVSISGKVTSQGTLPTKGTLSFNTADGKIRAFANFDGTYDAMLPAGTYDVSVIPMFGSTGQFLSLSLGKITVSGARTVDFVLPAAVALSGTVKYMNGAAAVPSSVFAGDFNAQPQPNMELNPCSGNPLITQSLTTGSSSIGKDSMTGAYRFVLPTGTYNAFVSVDLDPRDEVDSTLAFPNPLLQLALSADRTQDFTVPATPSFVTISGTVTDSMGQPVARASVSAFTSMITNTPNATFFTSTTTGNDGKYEMRVLSGTGYTITFCPPQPPSGLPGAKAAKAASCTSAVAMLHR
jgi:hypothetical protein